MDSDDLRALGGARTEERDGRLRLHPNTRCSNPRILALLRRYGIAETEDLGDLDALDPDRVVEVIERVVGSTGSPSEEEGETAHQQLQALLHHGPGLAAARESMEAVQRDNERLRAKYPYLFKME